MLHCSLNCSSITFYCASAARRCNQFFGRAHLNRCPMLCYEYVWVCIGHTSSSSTMLFILVLSTIQFFLIFSFFAVCHSQRARQPKNRSARFCGRWMLRKVDISSKLKLSRSFIFSIKSKGRHQQRQQQQQHYVKCFNCTRWEQRDKEFCCSLW